MKFIAAIPVYVYMRSITIASVTALLLLSACGGNGGAKQTATDTPTSGKVAIIADESYTPIIQAQIDAFEAAYTDARIVVAYKPENEIVQELIRTDSIRFAILNRQLTADEKSQFENKKLHPTELKIAYDAVALIVNKESGKDSLTMQELKSIFNQQITTWKQFNKQLKQDSILIVFDNQASSNARYIQEHFLTAKNKFPANCYAVKTNIDVLNYVAEHKNAIGVIGVNWISDKDDSLTKKYLKEVKMVAVADSANNYYRPYQGYIANKKYPLCREMYIIRQEARAGLGMGFSAYISGDKGQRIILKSGLVPATMPVRLIEVTH